MKGNAYQKIEYDKQVTHATRKTRRRRKSNKREIREREEEMVDRGAKKVSSRATLRAHRTWNHI